MIAAVIVLALLVLVLLLAAGVLAMLWRAAVNDLLQVEDLARRQHRRIRHLSGRCDGYRAELDALTVAGPTVEQRVIAALNPDAHQQTLSDVWLAYVDSLPTTHDRENL